MINIEVMDWQKDEIQKLKEKLGVDSDWQVIEFLIDECGDKAEEKSKEVS